MGRLSSCLDPTWAEFSEIESDRNLACSIFRDAPGAYMYLPWGAQMAYLVIISLSFGDFAALSSTLREYFQKMQFSV